MPIIIAHIDGPSGAGKTTAGKILENKHKFIKVIDIDDIRLSLKTMYPKTYTKLYKNDPIKFEFEYLEKGIRKYIKPFRYVILVGGAAPFYNNVKKIIDIDTQNKFYIDIDENVLIKQRFIRHLKYMVDNAEKYYQKTLKEPMCIDFEKWKTYNLYHDTSRETNYARYTDAKYKIMPAEEILLAIDDIIATKFKLL